MNFISYNVYGRAEAPVITLQKSGAWLDQAVLPLTAILLQ